MIEVTATQIYYNSLIVILFISGQLLVVNHCHFCGLSRGIYVVAQCICRWFVKYIVGTKKNYVPNLGTFVVRKKYVELPVLLSHFRSDFHRTHFV